jgi:hypothetical protein
MAHNIYQLQLSRKLQREKGFYQYFASSEYTVEEGKEALEMITCESRIYKVVEMKKDK